MSLMDEFFGSADKPRHEPAGTIGGKPIFAGELSALDWVEVRLEIAKARKESDGKPDLLADGRVLVRSILDEKNNYVFTHDEATVKRIMAQPDHVVDPIMAAVNKANAAGEAQLADLKKNSETTPSSPSSSDSPPSAAA